MPLNEQSGNMYGHVSHTWNPVGGACLHDCSYCYMKTGFRGQLEKYQGPARLVERELRCQLGRGRYIFVGSATDMWGRWVSDEAIGVVLGHCRRWPENRYLFQSKDPLRMVEFVERYGLEVFPPDVVLCSTVETDRDLRHGLEYAVSRAPVPARRAAALARLQALAGGEVAVEVTVEPVMDFSVDELAGLLRSAAPTAVNIGANTARSVELPEPPARKVRELVGMLEDQDIEVRLKKNLKRIMREVKV